MGEQLQTLEQFLDRCEAEFGVRPETMVRADGVVLARFDPGDEWTEALIPREEVDADG